MTKFILPNGYTEDTVLKTIRIKETKLMKLEELSYKHNLSVNKLMNLCLKYAIENLEDEENSENKNEMINQ